MTEPKTKSQVGKASDYRSLLYERYLTLQLEDDVIRLRHLMESPQPALEAMVEKFFPNNRDAAILDLGCGYGLLLHVLRSAGYRNLSGIETSAEQVTMAHTLGMDCVRQCDLVEMLSESEPERFDVILALDVIEHFTKDEILHIMDSIYQALKPGGTFLMHAPNGEAIFSGKAFFGDFTHQTAFTAKSVYQVAAYSGFSEIRCFEDKPIIHGVASFIRAGLWATVRTCYRIVNAAETGDLGSTLILSQNLFAVCRKSR